MPVTSLARAEKMAQLSGFELPSHIRAALEAAGPENEYEVGMELTAQLAAQSLAAGAGGLHIYTHNHVDVTVRSARPHHHLNLSHTFTACTGSPREKLPQLLHIQWRARV